MLVGQPYLTVDGDQVSFPKDFNKKLRPWIPRKRMTCHYVGAFLAAVLFSVTVVAMPLLLDRDIDFVSAMLTSIRVVTENPRVMLSWAAIITVTMLLSLVPAFLGPIFTLPILGHTTWHLYQRAVAPAEGRSAEQIS